MKTSIDFFNEFAGLNKPAGQKRIQELCDVDQTTVSHWKKRGGMTPAATVKVGMAPRVPERPMLPNRRHRSRAQ